MTKFLAVIGTIVVVGACGGDGREAAVESEPVVTRDAQLTAMMQTGTEWIAALGGDAQARATSPAARAYAAIVAADHRALTRELAGHAAQRTSDRAAVELANEAQTARTALQQMQGREFDLAFVENAIRLQQRLLSTITRDAGGVRSGELQQIANDTRPMLEAHIRRGRQLLPGLRAAEAGASPVAGPAVTGAAPATPTEPAPQRTSQPTVSEDPQPRQEAPPVRPAPAPDTTAPTPPDTNAVVLQGRRAQTGQ